MARLPYDGNRTDRERMARGERVYADAPTPITAAQRQAAFMADLQALLDKHGATLDLPYVDYSPCWQVEIQRNPSRAWCGFDLPTDMSPTPPSNEPGDTT